MTITDKLADALRQAIAATDKQAELLKAGVRDIPCPRDEARDAWREALAAYDAQQAQAAGLDEAIMQMGKPWHLSGAAEEYGFYHGKVAAAMLVRKSLGPLRAAEDETHA